MQPTSDAFRASASGVPAYQNEPMKPIMSLNGDIFLHRRCSRQYGLLKVRGFADTAESHVFIGELAHNTLEDATTFQATHHRAMTDKEVAALLWHHYEALLAKGAVPKALQAVKATGLKIMILHRTMDSLGILERVESAEQMLTKTDENYIFQGRIDAVRGHGSAAPELWDYKTGTDPRRILKRSRGDALEAIWKRHLNDCVLQLRLYHALYASTYGRQPSSCRLVFIGEVPLKSPDLKGTPKEVWEKFIATPLTKHEWKRHLSSSGVDGSGMFLTISTTKKDVEQALHELRDTASVIVEQRQADDWPAPSEATAPDEEKTCTTCAVRSSCDVPVRRGVQ